MTLAAHHCKRRSAAVLCAFLLPATAFAAVCPTATLDQVIALGSCTIGDATFGFTHPQLPGHPVYFAGPFAGNTGLGPAATTLTFTPNASTDQAGFTVSGSFVALGQASRYDPFSQTIRVGNFFDESLAYFDVTTGAGRGLSGYSVGLGSAHVSPGDGAGSQVFASLNNAVAVVNDDGFSQPSDSRTFEDLMTGTLQFFSNIHTWERSGDPTYSAGFSSIRYGFSERAITAAVPEPETYALLLAGLATMGWIGRRHRG